MYILILIIHGLLIAFTPVAMLSIQRTAQSTEPVLLDNCCSIKQLLTWKFDNVVLYYNAVPRDNILTGSVSLLPNNSLFISSVSLLHEGTYQCFCNTMQRQNYTLEVEVLPELLLTLNGYSIKSGVKVPFGEGIPLVCHAIGAKPSVELLWEIDGETFHPSEMITKGIKIYNTTTSYTGHLTEISGNISCLSSRGNNVTTRQRIDITYLTYVLPTVVLSINQKRSDHVIKVKHGDIQITCHAYGSRPMANLTLLYENQPLDNLTNITIFSTDNDVTFNTVATLNVKLEDNTGTIACVCSGMYWEPILTKAQFKVTEPLISPTTELLSPTSEVQTQQSSQKSYLFVMPFIFVISLLGVVGFFLHKVKAVRASVMQVNQELPMDISKENRTKGGTLNQSTSLEDEPMSVMESTRSSVKSQKEKSFSAHTDDDSPRPPDLQLPDIPITAGMVSCSVEESLDDVYYSSVKETATQGRIFYAKDMRLILNMKMGDFHNRWMGTIGASTDKTKCVLITTVSEKSLQKKELHWDDYVKRVLEMPNSRNLPIAEGICIDAAHLYLVQEHFICETLDVRVNTSLETEGATHVHAPLDMAEIKRYVLDIIEGMVAIHSYGFLHPGLSTKKILLSQQGICKLYDFCLSEDAVKVVPVKKAKGLSSVNQLAPEALQRNEYNWASDVWSLAVLIWEIFSGGIPPFVSDAGATDYANNVPNPQSVWPSHLKSLQNELLLSCWDAEAYFRPTVNDLKISYLQVFESVRTDETYQVRRSTLMDLYVPMKGATSSTGSGGTPSTND